MTGLIVSARPRPFSPAIIGVEMPDGLTVSEIIERAPVDADFKSSIVVMVNGHEINRTYWHRTRILSISRIGAPVIVTLDPLPEGKGVRNLLMIAGAIAITIGTAWIGGGGLAALLGPAFGAGTTGAQVAAGAFGFLGSLALQALAPPPITPNNERPGRAKQLAGISGNQPALLEQIPTVEGKMVVSPVHIIPPYTSLTKTGDTQVHAVVGLAGQHQITNIRINGTKIDDVENLLYETREGWDDDDPLTLTTITVLEEAPNSKLDEFDLKESHAQRFYIEDQGHPTNSTSHWHTFATRGEADQIVVRFFWPQGMVWAEPNIDLEEGENPLEEAATPIRLQIRLEGETDWRNLPEFHFHNFGSRQKEIRQQILLIWNDVEVSFSADDGRHAYWAFWKAAPGQTWEWQADSYFDPGDGSILPNRVTNAVNKCGYVVYLDPAEFPKGKYEVRVRGGLRYVVASADFGSVTYEYGGSATQANFFDYFDDGSGTIQVSVPQREFSATCYLEAFQTIRNDYPILQKNLTMIAVVATNLQITSVAAAFTKYAPVWTGSAWTVDPVDWEPTQNPAALLRHVWTGGLNAKAKDLAIVDSDNLADFYEDCESRGYECNAIIEAGQSVDGVAQLIASTGYAAIAKFEKWGVVMDRARSGDTITQLYTPLNTKNFRVERNFADIPHAIKAEFIDSEDTYKLKERVVYREGYTALTATEIEGMRYPGFVTENAIDFRVTRDFRQLTQRGLFYKFETGIENLRTPQGALCGISHDILASSAFHTYVKAKTINTGNVVSISLEAEMDFATAKGAAVSVGAQIRLRDGSIIVKQIDETTASSIVTFTTPFADTANLEKDCLVAFGPLASETKRVVVLEIEQLDDDRARLTCLDEAPGVYAAMPGAHILGIGGGRVLGTGSGNVLGVT